MSLPTPASTSAATSHGGHSLPLTDLGPSLRLFALRVLDGFVNTEHQAGGLAGGFDGVDLDQGRLPDEALHVVGHAALAVDVDAGPEVALVVQGAELVEHVCAVEAGVVAQLAGDDL